MDNQPNFEKNKKSTKQRNTNEYLEITNWIINSKKLIVVSKHNSVIFEPIFRTHLYKSLNTKGLFRTHSVQRLILMM